MGQQIDKSERVFRVADEKGMDMKEIPIYLNSMDVVRDFVNCMSKIKGETVIRCERYVINAKSIMGIFSLDLTKPLMLEIEEWKEEYAELLKEYGR